MPTLAKFDPGFRLSKLDCLVLLVGAAAVFFAAQLEPHLGVVIAFVVGHFFLFCNVIRMRRAQELVWSAAFVSLCLASSLFGSPSWFQTFGFTLMLTVILCALEMRDPSYHGVCWKRVNPSLEKWWQSKGGQLS